MKSKLTVAFQGGLGNQLFQWAFSHSYVDHKAIRIDLLDNPGRDTVLNKQSHQAISPLLNSCNHLTEERYLQRKYFHILNYLAIYIKSPFIYKTLRYFRDYPIKGLWKNKFRIDQARYAYGYFQSAGVVAEVEKFIDSELEPLLQHYWNRVNLRMRLPKNFSAIHVRRYPVKGVKLTPNVIGNLHEDYYNSWLSNQANENVIVLGYSKEDLKAFSLKFPGLNIIDNQLASPWETLAIIRNSQGFLSSNSSMSWWGAFLASRHGCQVFLPSEWSQWENIEMVQLQIRNAKFHQAKWDRSGYAK